MSQYLTPKNQDLILKIIIESLTAQLERFPTEEELTKFIFGTPEERTLIWNSKNQEL